MKNKKTYVNSLQEKHSESSAWYYQILTNLLNSNWKLAAIIAALSAWTGGILYV